MPTFSAWEDVKARLLGYANAAERAAYEQYALPLPVEAEPIFVREGAKK